MQFALTSRPGQTTAFLNGRFTFADHQAFRDLLRHIGSTKLDRFVIDLSAVEFLDSAALGMLLVASDACHDAGSSFLVQSPRGQVRRTLDIAEMGAVFAIQD